MRLPPIRPETLSEDQRPLYADMKQGIATSFQGFTTAADDCALLGPWNPWLHFPQFGRPMWELVKALSSSPKLPTTVREVAILVTGSHFNAGYAMYAHILVAELRGLSDDTVATICAGQRPSNLTREEAIAYDVTSALISGRLLPKLSCDQARAAFGDDGFAELIYLVGLYCCVAATLNGFDVPVPE